MAYAPNPIDVTQPIDSVFASTAAAEFRALKAYIQTIVAGAVLGNQTPGMIVAFPGGGAAPAGWLECDGSLQLRSTFTGLYAALAAMGAVTSEAVWATGYYGWATNGDTVTNFRLPDLRGFFIRGWNHGRADIWSDPGRAAGVLQMATEVYDNGGNAGALIQAWTGSLLSTRDYLGAGTNASYNLNAPGSSATVVLQTAGVRPVNMALKYCIKT